MRSPLPESTTVRLHLPPAVLGDLETWARAEYPNEACGLLLGRSRTDTGRVVVRVVRCANLNRERDRYQLDPVDHLAAEKAAHREGLEVIGVWHTHPDHPAQPSETDRAAAWEGWSYVIVAVIARGVNDVRSFRLRANAFIEEEIQRTGVGG